MKVAFSTSSQIGNKKTGLSVYMLEILTALLEVDDVNEYFVYIPRNHKNLFKDIIKTQKPKTHFIYINSLFNRPVLNILWHLLIYPIYLRVHKIDVLHLPEYRRLVWFAPCRTVMTVHDLIGVITRRFGFFRYIYNQYLVFPFLKRIDHFITVSENTRNDLIKLTNVDPQKITVIYEGAPRGFKERCPAEIPADFIRRYDKGYLLYVARIEHPNKNHYNLIKAFKLLKEAPQYASLKLLLVGKPYWNSDIIFKQIEEYQLSDSIIRTGHVDDEELPYFYNLAELMVFPSVYEGFGFPLIEAYASGLPVICSNSSSLSELSCNKKMLFDPHDPVEIKNRIIEYLSDGQLREEQIKLQKQYLNYFNWGNSARDTLRIYNESGSPSEDHRTSP